MRRSLAQPRIDKQRKKEALLFVNKMQHCFLNWAVPVSTPRAQANKNFAPLF
jgi:hypothetical protein